MTRHIDATDLALCASRDLALWRRVAVQFHVKRCTACGRRLEQYHADRRSVRQDAAGLPEGLDWNRLASEMSANIRVGLAAGECVAPRARKVAGFGWRFPAVAAGLVVLMSGAWWLNLPPSDTQSLGRAMRSIFNGGNDSGNGVARRAPLYRGPMVEALASGITLYENGSSLGVSQGTAPPLAVSVSVQGSASARYVDADTGQITITSVYVQ